MSEFIINNWPTILIGILGYIPAVVSWFTDSFTIELASFIVCVLITVIALIASVIKNNRMIQSKIDESLTFEEID